MDDSATPILLKDLFAIDVHADRYDWKPFKEGVEIHVIYGDEKNGPSAALLRYQRSAEVPLHVHQGYEHILVLAGSQSDGREVFERGTLVVSTPGSSHQVTSPDGCIVLAIWQQPVRFVPD